MAAPDTAERREALKFGVLPSPNYTTWPALRDIAVEIDALGYDSLWCSDHLSAPYPGTLGPVFEGYMVLGGWSQVTRRVTLGLMVTCNGFRNPALVAKMVTTLDHMTGGRAVLGIGAGWFEDEHRSFGFEFPPVRERLERLEEALQIARAMLGGETADGRRHYRADRVDNDPPPLQRRVPILVGGAGERTTLRLVATYADAWNLPGTIEDVRRKNDVLRAHCENVGRDAAEIERTYHAGPVFIRDRVEDARELERRTFAAHGLGGIEVPLAGPPEALVEHLAPFVELGFRHLYFDLISPYDRESLTRLIEEVRPALVRAGG